VLNTFNKLIPIIKTIDDDYYVIYILKHQGIRKTFIKNDKVDVVRIDTSLLFDTELLKKQLIEYDPKYKNKIKEHIYYNHTYISWNISKV
jgi:hypothetical protein